MRINEIVSAPKLRVKRDQKEEGGQNLKRLKKIKLCAAEASSEHNMESDMVTLLGKTVYLPIQESESAS